MFLVIVSTCKRSQGLGVFLRVCSVSSVHNQNVLLLVLVFWIVTPCSDVAGYRRLGGPCCLHLQVIPPHLHRRENLKSYTASSWSQLYVLEPWKPSWNKDYGTKWRARFYGSILGRCWKFLSSPPCPDRLWGLPSLLPNGYRGLFLRR
jgi:hypothetical protein